ncbi:MAG: flavodoxin family protein [bacterium]|nr:flavodoxin family protein [bacterium]
MKKHIVAVMGSYRKDGITHQAVKSMLEELETGGASIDVIDLLDKDINFCNNCRLCMQNEPEQSRGDCVHSDDMNDILDSIDRADGIILASPINMFSITALMKRFMERLAVYGYWPWGAVSPSQRKQDKQRTTVILTTSGSPKFVVKLFGGKWTKALKTLAKFTLESKTIKRVHIDGVAKIQDQALSPKQVEKVKKAARVFGGE